MKPVYLCLILVLVITGYGYAAVIHVPSDQPTIKRAIYVAHDGDTIVIDNAKHTEAGIAVNKNLTIQGHGPENTIVQGHKNKGDANDGVFEIIAGKTVAIRNMTIRHGVESQVGAGSGAGIENWGKLALINCTVRDNIVEHMGGGILNGSEMTLLDCTVDYNAANFGGGITNAYKMALTNCTVSDNTATIDGGGINNMWGEMTATSCTINDNTAKEGGGISSNWKMALTNCIVSANKADYGGAIENWDKMILTNCTVSNNKAVLDGGGLYCNISTTIVKNCIFWGNSDNEIIVASGNAPVVTYSDIAGGWAGIGNIDADPLFVDLDNGSYYLQAGSLCLGAANCAAGPTEDKDGQPRPLGSGCDMGCYEECDAGIWGYISSDCNITAYDSSLALQFVVGSIDLSERQKIAADVTGNGNITALDAALILQYVVGLISPFRLQQGAPILTTKDENETLVRAIVELEHVPLTTEQKHVLASLRDIIERQSPPNDTGHTALLPNYPNPFNPETWIPFELAQNAPVTISIYNAKGQLVRTIALAHQKAGVYLTKAKAAHWNGLDNAGERVASGVYYYTLQAGEYRATRRMVVVK